jgi:hypothetical protein
MKKNHLFKRTLLSSGLILAGINCAYSLGNTTALGSYAGEQLAYSPSTWSSISADGRYVTLTAVAGYIGYVFLYDRFNNTVAALMPTSNGIGALSKISADGRYVAMRISKDMFIYDTWTKDIYPINKSSSGELGNGMSYFAALSADGNIAAFSSDSANLVANDTNNSADIFVHNRKTAKTVRVSVSSTGKEAPLGIGNSGIADISANGRFVVFSSAADNFVSNDLKATEDVFVHDLNTKITALVSVPVTQNGKNGHSSYPSISANGQFIAYQSAASKLVANDTPDSYSDIFVYDRINKITTKITRNANGHSIYPAISADGRYVAFMSQASNLVLYDTNKAWDTFVYDRKTAKTRRVNVKPSGGQSSGDRSLYQAKPAISADGRFISFESGAADLATNDVDSASTDVFCAIRC